MNSASLKTRLIAAVALMYLVVGVAVFLAYQVVADNVVSRLGAQFAVKQAMLEKSRLNASIQRDLFLSQSLASSSYLLRWVADEGNERLKNQAVEEMENFRRNFSEGTLFLALHRSGNYYFSDGGAKNSFQRPRYVLRSENPNDAWYFRVMREVPDFELNVDYDNHLDLTKIWFNVVMKDGSGEKIGMCGGAIDVTSFVRDVVDTKEEGVDTVLVSRDGSIEGHRNRKYVIHNSKVRGREKKYTIYDLLENEQDRKTVRDAIKTLTSGGSEVVTSFINVGGKRYLAAVSHLREIGWFNLVLLDLKHVIRSDQLLPILIASIAALLALIIGIGFLINRIILRPVSILSGAAKEIAGGNFDVRTGLQSRDEIGALSGTFDYMARMVKDHTENLEGLVRERTEELDRSHRELAESNRKIMDGISYARMIQESILPDPVDMRARVKDLLIIYRPRDMVGGDFYYFRDYGKSFIIAVGDCTGHGVPGAFMSMTAKVLLDRVSDSGGGRDPALLLAELNRLMRETLHQGQGDERFDNGLEIGVCAFIPEQGELLYAGAGIDLFCALDGEPFSVPGARQPIGYRRSDPGFVYTSTRLTIAEGMMCYLVSDGILDQSGGEKGWGFGKKRFSALLGSIRGLSGEEQRVKVEKELAAYQGKFPQRDDITLLGFRL